MTKRNRSERQTLLHFYMMSNLSKKMRKTKQTKYHLFLCRYNLHLMLMSKHNYTVMKWFVLINVWVLVSVCLRVSVIWESSENHSLKFNVFVSESGVTSGQVGVKDQLCVTNTSSWLLLWTEISIKLVHFLTMQ